MPVHENNITRRRGYTGVILQINIRGYQFIIRDTNQVIPGNSYLKEIHPKSMEKITLEICV